MERPCEAMPTSPQLPTQQVLCCMYCPVCSTVHAAKSTLPIVPACACLRCRTQTLHRPTAQRFLRRAMQCPAAKVPTAACPARPSFLQYDSPSAGGKPAAAAAKLADNAEVAARRAGDAATGAASEATAAAANVFLSEGGEKQQDEVRPEVAEATAARTAGRSGTSGGGKKAD